jgi:hypothetical protein
MLLELEKHSTWFLCNFRGTYRPGMLWPDGQKMLGPHPRQQQQPRLLVCGDYLLRLISEDLDHCIQSDPPDRYQTMSCWGDLHDVQPHCLQ